MDDESGHDQYTYGWDAHSNIDAGDEAWCLTLSAQHVVREAELHIFIDESGTFALDKGGHHSISAVGALVIPCSAMKGFEKLYGRLRRHLPKTKGEVKGRDLSEKEVVEVSRILRKIGALFEVVAVDMGMHSEEDLDRHKSGQADAVTAHLTSDHHPNLVKEVWQLRRQLEDMPNQLYVQSAAMGELVYQTLNHSNIYYAFRIPSELGEYHWIIDGKDKLGVTPWEKWWSYVIFPMLESHTLREPFVAAEGGNYRWHERFRMCPSDYKMSFVTDSRKSEYFDLGMIMKEHFRFSSDSELGLEAVDIATNTIKRSLSGNFTRSGWMSIQRLMITRASHCITMITLSRESAISRRIPYENVLADFRYGGRTMFPRGYYKK